MTNPLHGIRAENAKDAAAHQKEPEMSASAYVYGECIRREAALLAAIRQYGFAHADDCDMSFPTDICPRCTCGAQADYEAIFAGVDHET